MGTSSKSARTDTRPSSAKGSAPCRPRTRCALAKASVAAPELESQVAFEMRLLIEQHDFLDRQIATAEAELAGLLNGETARRLMTIPGVGPATAATLLAERGDIWHFTQWSGS